MLKAHKIRLNPTPAQAEYFMRAAGCARFVFNWGLEHWKAEDEASGKPSVVALKKHFNAIKREEFPFVLAVTKTVAEGAFMDLGTAFRRFFRGVKAGQSVGFPKFKSKKRSKPSFYLANDKIAFDDNGVKIPKLGWVNMTESLRFDGKVMSARGEPTSRVVVGIGLGRSRGC